MNCLVRFVATAAEVGAPSQRSITIGKSRSGPAGQLTAAICKPTQSSRNTLIANSSVKPGGRNAGLVFLFLSGVLLLVSIYLAFDAWSLTRDGIVATGRIVAVEKRRPTVRVPTLDGKLRIPVIVTADSGLS